MPQPSAEMRQKFEAKFESAAKDAGFDVGQLKDLRSQIETAVKDASANSTSGDIKGDIESAINGVLEDNGIDPAEFKEKMGGVFEKMGMPKPGSAGFGGGGGYSAGGLSVNGNQSELLSKLLSLLGGDSSGSIFGNLPAGSLVDAAA
jgi:hypothetical protein